MHKYSHVFVVLSRNRRRNAITIPYYRVREFPADFGRKAGKTAFVAADYRPAFKYTVCIQST